MWAVYVNKPDGFYMVEGPFKTREEADNAFWEIRNHFYNQLEIRKVSKNVCGVRKNAKLEG